MARSMRPVRAELVSAVRLPLEPAVAQVIDASRANAPAQLQQVLIVSMKSL